MSIVVPIILLYGQILIVYGKFKSYLFANILYAVSQIGVAFYTLKYGIYWMAFSIGVITFVYVLVWHWLVAKMIPITIIHGSMRVILYVNQRSLIIYQKKMILLSLKKNP